MSVFGTLFAEITQSLAERQINEHPTHRQANFINDGIDFLNAYGRLADPVPAYCDNLLTHQKQTFR
jgi:hypothetical protein